MPRYRFLSTLSLRRATLWRRQKLKISEISIHALLAESDRQATRRARNLLRFLSTLSLRRATPALLTPLLDRRYFYPRSPCGERLLLCEYPSHFLNISIHALLAESDPKSVFPTPTQAKFLSTLSLRRATTRSTGCRSRPRHFYPRSPCGERLVDLGQNCGNVRNFYPRSPCGERPRGSVAPWALSPFLSTLSLRRATCNIPIFGRYYWIISIHALLAESDGPWSTLPTDTANFYPRSPCGERPPPSPKFPLVGGISIHALLAESDFAITDLTLLPLDISIHALLAESDRCGFPPKRRHRNFYPRSPCGERLVTFQHPAGLACISIHALLAESDALSPKATKTR